MPNHQAEKSVLTAVDDCCGAGRRAAGEDPAKRQQILDGAKRVFVKLGFDAASMNDITREAGVSKGTIYVYFQNKEDLFGELIEQERNRIVEAVQHALDEHEPIDEALLEFGLELSRNINSTYTIGAMRMVLGVIDRMPDLALRFFAATPQNGFTVLKRYLDTQVAAGRITIADTEIAAAQFIEMSMAGLFKKRLFGLLPTEPDPHHIHKVVTSAVDVFLRAYQRAET